MAQRIVDERGRITAMLAACSISLAACAATFSEPPSDPRTTAFVGIDVLPMTTADAILEDQTLIVSGGRIAAIGARGSVRIPRGAARVQARGQYLLPGLVDMHVHLEHLEDPDILKLFIAHGVTTVRNMDGRPFILDWRRRVEEGELPGPEIRTAGPIIDGSPPILPDNLAVETPEDARSAVIHQADSGYDFIKVYTALSPDAYAAVAEAAQERGLPIAGHIPRQVSVGEALSQFRSIEHLADYRRVLDSRSGGSAPRWHWSYLFLAVPIDAERLSDLAASLALAGVWTVPTLIERERAVATSDELARWLALPETELIPDAAVEHWTEEVRGASSRLDGEDWELLAQGRQNRLEVVAALHRQGAGLLAGTDTPNAFVVPGASLHDELRLFVEAGLTPGEALLAATRDAARALGSGDRFGTIEVGMEADLILLGSDPRQEIGNLSSLRGVMSDGRWHSGPQLAAFARALKARHQVERQSEPPAAEASPQAHSCDRGGRHPHRSRCSPEPM